MDRRQEIIHIIIYQALKLHDNVTFQMLYCVVTFKNITLCYNIFGIHDVTVCPAAHATLQCNILGNMTPKWQHQAINCVILYRYIVIGKKGF